VSLLGKFISVREPNIKYLGLENMVRLAAVPAVMDAVNRWGTRAVRQLDGWMDGYVDMWTNEGMDGWTVHQASRRKDRPTAL
jgi:hypothetical protein